MIALRDKSLPWSENLRQYHVSEDEEGAAVHEGAPRLGAESPGSCVKGKGYQPEDTGKNPIEVVWH